MDNEIVSVIDDDDDVRKALQLLLQSVGLNVNTFSSAQEYLDQFDVKQPGCLIVDVRMPGMSGLELQQQLLGLRQQITQQHQDLHLYLQQQDT